MKRGIKRLIIAAAICTIGAFSAFCLTGCSMSKWVEQQKCEHEWNEGEVTLVATCTQVGERTFTCTKCEKETKEEVASLPHTEETVPTVEATCTEKGYVEYIKCSVCEAEITEKKELPAQGHIEVKDAAIAAMCTTKGKTEGSHCSRCSEVFVAQEDIPATGHNPVKVAGYAATCGATGLTDGQKCEYCGLVFTEREEIPATGEHSLVTVEGYAATCGATGLTDGQKCEVCDYTEEGESIPATGEHSLVTVVGYAATCTVGGYTDKIECSECGHVAKSVQYIEPTGHTYVDSVCTGCGVAVEMYQSELERVVQEGVKSDQNWYTTTFSLAEAGAEFKTDTIYMISIGEYTKNADIPLGCIDVENYSERWEGENIQETGLSLYYNKNSGLFFDFCYPLMWEDGPSDDYDTTWTIPFYMDRNELYFVIPEALFTDGIGLSFTFNVFGSTDYGNTIYLRPTVRQGEYKIYEGVACTPQIPMSDIHEGETIE